MQCVVTHARWGHATASGRDVDFPPCAVAQTSEKEMLQKEQKGKGVDKDASEEVLYKIDIPANRYDMLCLGGIARALNIFNQRLSRVEYRLANMQGAHPYTSFYVPAVPWHPEAKLGRETCTVSAMMEPS